MDRLIEYAGNHPWLVTAAVLAALLVLVFELRSRQDNFAAIPPQELIRLMNQGALVLDLRSTEDFAAGHIGGARRMDSAEILKAAETLKKYKEKAVIVCCNSGSLGASAARTLVGQGFTKVFNLRGGLAGWRAENLPLSRDKDKGKA
jgi:rhodanese-related sulfurtransferase